MLEDAKFWILIASAAFVAAVWKPASKAALGMLDGYTAKVRDQLEEARRLREEAQQLLAHNQRRHRDALKEAEQIVAHARDEASRLRAEAEASLSETIARRKSQALDRIAQAEQAAVREVRSQAADLAIVAARSVLAERLQGEAASKLIDQAIGELSGKLH